MKTWIHPVDIARRHFGRALLAAFVVVVAAILPPLGLAQPGFAPDFRAKLCFTADSLTLSDFFDFPVVLFFFDAGDAGCLAAYPFLINWHTKYKEDDFKFIGIHSPFYQPTRSPTNAVAAVAQTHIVFPVVMDFDRTVFKSYSLDRVPVLMLLKPGGSIVAAASGPSEYHHFEVQIQNVLRTIEPDVVLPFLFNPKGLNGEDSKYPPPSPRITLGYESGAIANADSAGFDQFWRYTDPGARGRGKAYLEGRWKLADSLVTYDGGEAAHIRLVYSGQDVWLLPDFPLDQTVRIYIEQDRGALPKRSWGRDMKTDFSARTFVETQYSIPLHVVRNPSYGTHELKIIPEQRDVSFHYLFFQGARRPAEAPAR